MELPLLRGGSLTPRAFSYSLAMRLYSLSLSSKLFCPFSRAYGWKQDSMMGTGSSCEVLSIVSTVDANEFSASAVIFFSILYSCSHTTQISSFARLRMIGTRQLGHVYSNIAQPCNSNVPIFDDASSDLFFLISGVSVDILLLRVSNVPLCKILVFEYWLL